MRNRSRSRHPALRRKGPTCEAEEPRPATPEAESGPGTSGTARPADRYGRRAGAGNLSGVHRGDRQHHQLGRNRALFQLCLRRGNLSACCRYPLEDDSIDTTVDDVSGNDCAGTRHSAPSHSSSKPSRRDSGGSSTFDATTSYRSTPALVEHPRLSTTEFWFRWITAGGMLIGFPTVPNLRGDRSRPPSPRALRSRAWLDRPPTPASTRSVLRGGGRRGRRDDGSGECALVPTGVRLG